MNDRTASAESWRRALELTAPIAQHPTVTLPVVVDRLAARFGDATALLSEHQTLTYRELADRAGRYARWALAQNIGPGDVVCLLMPNCPEYLAIWLGITRVGGVVALLNTNLGGAALRHAVDIVSPTHAIVDAERAATFTAASPKPTARIEAWIFGGDAPGWARIDRAIEHGEAGPPDHALPTLRDPALYIYTSGTTGLPKAASVSHYRVIQWSHWFAGLIGARADDRMYNCLPMYHSIGGVVATCAPLVAGASVLLRDRFSARRFWDDVSDHQCTLFQYIGELCRYLVAAPVHPREAGHRLRLACGNGLRAEVWSRLQERFNIPRIIEFYAATEASFSLFNCDGKPGAIGRVPPFMAHRFPVALIRLDLDRGEPLRGADGLCIRCDADEPGEAIGKLADAPTLGGRFEGYTDPQASARKLLHDVFAPGDVWYRSGDLMRKDRAGFFYFVDRLGDTFRWKGENVSTAEVEEVIAACPGVADAVVYGVAVPGADGRAGMAAIVPAEGFDPARLAMHLNERLPDYARPVFVRLCGEIAATGTFKPQKRALAESGFDPAATHDPIHVYDRRRERYVPLDAAGYRLVQRGELRL